MKETDYLKIVAMKLNIRIAYAEFKERYKKVTEGIENLKTMALLSDNLKEIETVSGKFFGYITKSLKAKKLREKIDEV